MKISILSRILVKNANALLVVLGACSASPVVGQTPTPTPAPTPKKAETPLTSLGWADTQFIVTPEGPYSVVKNLPRDKEIWAYVKGKGKLIMDPNDSTITVEPFLGGKATFTARAQYQNQNIFPNQHYAWEPSPVGYYIPIINPPGPNTNRIVKVGRNIAGAIDETLITTSPAFGYLSSKWDIQGSDLFLPAWWEDAVVQTQLSLNYGFPPSAWRTDFSEPTKTFHWNFGNDAQSPPNESLVEVEVKEANTTAPAVKSKVKIKWHKPPQLVYDVEFSTAEWQRNGDTETYSDWGAFFGSAAANQKLADALTLDASIGAVATPVVIGVGAGAKVAFRVVLNKAASSPYVARKMGDALSRMIKKEALERGWPNFGRRVEVVVAERGFGGAAVQGAIERRISGPGPTIAEATPHTAWRGGGCFAGETLIMMADGSLKPIKYIRVGDKVVSGDPHSNLRASKRVSNVFSRFVHETLTLSLSNGDLLRVTPNHPFFVANSSQDAITRTIVEAGYLTTESTLLTGLGGAPRGARPILSISRSLASVQVFNFSVEDYQTYFVGGDRIWVHNQNPFDLDSCMVTNTGPASAQSDNIGDQLGGHSDDANSLTSAPNPDPILPVLDAHIWEEGNKKCSELLQNLGDAVKWTDDEGIEHYRMVSTGEMTDISGDKVSLLPTVSGGQRGEGSVAPTYVANGVVHRTSPGTGEIGISSPALPRNFQMHSEIKMLEQALEFLRANPQWRGTVTIHNKWANPQPFGRPCSHCDLRIKEFVNSFEGRVAVVASWGRRELKQYNIHNSAL